jgi:hypothetical protein
VFRPTLVLPKSLRASLSEKSFRQVLLHELAHLKRHHLFWGGPIETARIVYCFHPLVYWGDRDSVSPGRRQKTLAKERCSPFGQRSNGVCSQVPYLYSLD